MHDAMNRKSIVRRHGEPMIGWTHKSDFTVSYSYAADTAADGGNMCREQVVLK